jgi:branched-chain amino acid transport system substrate-binding protein
MGGTVHQRSVVRVGASLIVASLALTACGSRSNDNGGGGSGTTTKTAKIGVIAPLSGDLSALGLGIQHSVELAVKQANDSNAIPGWKLEVDAQDDEAKPDVGKNAATSLSSDPNVIGVVGTLNSSVALQVQPVLAPKNIVQISPANTNPSLTQGQDYLKTKTRPFKSYFRVATTDLIQGAFAADYAATSLKAKSVYLVNDKLVYGQGLTKAFGDEFTKKGGKVLGTQFVATDQKDFSAVVSKVKQAKPDMVFYGGQFPEGAPFSKQLRDAGLNVPFMGGDGLVDKGFIKTAAVKTAADYATNVGAAVEDLPAAAQYVSDYKAAGYTDAFSAYGPNTFDCAQVIIAALAKVLPGKSKIDDSVRQAVVAAVQATSLQGVTGSVAFDQYGDTTNKIITMYKVTDGDFKKVQTGTFAG